MLSCKDFNKVVGALLEGERHPEAQAHIEACAACRRLWEDLLAIREAGRSLPSYEPSPQLWTRLKQNAEADGLWRKSVSCEKVQELADALLEGEGQPNAFAHLEHCQRCQTFMNDLATILHASRLLPTYEPSPRLLASLRRQAEAQGLWETTSWWQRFFPVRGRVAFASGLAGFVLALAIGLAGYHTTGIPGSGLTDVSLRDVAQAELVAEPEYARRYGRQLIQVEQSVLDESSHVSEDLLTLVEGPLNTVEQAIEQTERVLARYPDDTMARAELNRLYRQKASVLQAVVDPAWNEYGD